MSRLWYKCDSCGELYPEDTAVYIGLCNACDRAAARQIDRKPGLLVAGGPES